MTKQDGIRQIQGLIRHLMEDLETISGWKILHPVMTNTIRKAIIRMAWDAYKVGMTVSSEE